MNKPQILNYYPNALVMFVSGFQSSATEKNTLILSNLANKANKLTQQGLTNLIYSISVERTTRNSPGTFSLTLFNTNNILMKADEPSTEIATLYKYSNRKKTVKSSQSTTANKVTSNNGVNNYRTLSKENAIFSEDSITEPGNYYTDQTFEDWMSSENIILEDYENGNRYPLMLQQTKNGTSVYWAYDFDGNVFKVNNPSTTEDGAIIDVSYKIDTKSVTRKFIVHKYKNALFVENYKDTINQGQDKSKFNAGKCRIQAMDRVVIFMTERFPNNSEPDLVRVFTGVVNTVEDGYTEGRSTITVRGEDVTKYMKLSLVNANPALLLDRTTDVLQAGDQRLTVWGDIFKGMTAPDIVKTCTVGGTTKMTGVDNLSQSIEGIGTYTLTSYAKYALNVRFSQEDNNWVKVDSNGEKVKIDFSQILGALFKKNTVHICDPYSKNSDLIGFRPYALSVAASWSFYQGDWKTRREIVYRAAEDSHFVFYADHNGEIWFQPRRFSNSWILGAEKPEVYIIDTESIINYGFVESDENIYTAVLVSTEPPLGMAGVQTLGLFNKSFRDDTGILKYGFRVFTSANPVINLSNVKGSTELDETTIFSAKSQNSLLMYAKTLLQRLLSQKYQGQVVITGRAEIEQGRPVYIPFRNMIYYIETVSHEMTAGGNFTTTLHLAYGRKPWEYLPELLTMAGDDEVYMTDAALLDNIEVQTESASEQTKNKPAKKTITHKPTIDSSAQQNFEILNIDFLKPLKALIGRELFQSTNSGIRTPVSNARVGGAPGSLHLKGQSVDINADGLSALELYTVIKQLVGLGKLSLRKCIYEFDHVHIDYVRGDSSNLFYKQNAPGSKDFTRDE